MKHLLGALVLIVGHLCVPTGALALDVTLCGQVIPPRETGVLQADLDCPGTPHYCLDYPATACTTDSDCGNSGWCVAPAVQVEKRATLDLNGHTLKGGAGATVLCTSYCTVVGPGAIDNDVATPQIGIYLRTRGKISDVVIDGGYAGIMASQGKPRRRIHVTNVTVNDAAFYGIFSYHKVVATNVTVNGSGGPGISISDIIGDNVTANGNSTGIWATRVRLSNVTAMNNANYGVGGGRLRVTGGTVTDNGMGDVYAWKTPRLTGVTCGTSTSGDSSWGVCQND